MSKEILEKAAQEAFDYNPTVNKYHVTSDAECFANKSDAVNWARGLENTSIEVFERDSEEDFDDDEDEDEEIKPLPAATLIALIQAELSADAILQLLGEDKRKTVVAAANKRIEELKQADIEQQAANADEAFKNRLIENPGSLTEKVDGDDSDTQNQ